jgi:hypothetical protein
VGQQDAFFNHALVQYRQDSRHPAAYRANISIRLVVPRVSFAGTENLALRVELDMRFKTDYSFVFHEQSFK